MGTYKAARRPIFATNLRRLLLIDKGFNLRHTTPSHKLGVFYRPAQQ